MITAIYFKCSDGSRFKAAITYHEDPIEGGAGEIAITDETDDQVAFARFYDEEAAYFGKYSVLARKIKQARIYDRGIDHVTIERSFPYHEQGMQKLLIAEKRIALEMKINRTHWATRARKTWKHKFAEK